MTLQFGRYETLEEIGRGAMGIVYRARDPQIDRLVALKTLTLPAGSSAEEHREMQDRFDREARTAGRLVHPNIVQVYDSGAGFIAMELVDGMTLDRWMAQGAVPRDLSLSILRQVSVALDHAHRLGVIHRDVKPSNVILSRAGVAKIMDFGIAKILGATMATSRLMGTPRYMSPEQVSGGVVGAPSDNFAFAGIAYELLSGHKAFPGETVANILYSIVHEDPPPPSRLERTLPRAVDPVFARALAKTPVHRYERASDFVRELEGALARGDSEQDETQVGAVLPAPARGGFAAMALRILLIPPAVIAAAIVTLLLLVPEARDAARDYMAAAPGPPPADVPAQAPTVAPAPLPARVPPTDPSAEASPEAIDPPAPASRTPATPAPLEPGPVVAALASPPPVRDPLGHAGLLGLRFFPTPIPGIGGAVVRAVEPGSPGARAGLRPKDVITSWQGAAIAAPGDLEGQDRSPSGRFSVAYLREEGGALQPRSTTVVLGATGGAPRVSLGGVRIDHGQATGDGRGMAVRVDVEASGYRDRRLTVRIRFQEITADGGVFVDGPDGSPLERTAELLPAADTWVSGQTSLFVAYRDLGPVKGERAMRILASVVDESGRELAGYAPLPFVISGS